MENIGAPPTVEAGPDQEICLGESTVLNAVFTGNPQVSWSPTAGLASPNTASTIATPTTTTTYIVTVTYPGGTFFSDNVTVQVNPVPDASVNPTVSTILQGETQTLTGNGNPPDSFEWFEGGLTLGTGMFTTSSTTIDVSPTSSTLFSLVVTNAFNCSTVSETLVNVISPDQDNNCNTIYVSSSMGVEHVAAGTRSEPTGLIDAVSRANGNSTTIKLGIGIYVLDAALNIPSNATLEGGFDPTNNWTKTSLTGATTLFRSSSGNDGSTQGPALIAIRGDSDQNFRFQDITITTADGPDGGSVNNLPAFSVYAAHLTGCSNYHFVRCQLLPGKGGDGANGVTGTNGTNGGNGLPGSIGSEDNESINLPGGAGGSSPCGCTGGNGGRNSWDLSFSGGGQAGTCSGGSNGGPGNSGGNDGADGVTPGSGGSGGGDACSAFNCANPGAGGTGSNGLDGMDGPNGSPGLDGILVNGFWLPGTEGGTGGTGGCGSGGGGGGGGGSEAGAFCNDGSGNSGSGGGGGASGGTGGSGGYGGGSSFAVMLVNNGTNGAFLQSSSTLNLPGSGGVGGQGGSGGTGGFGGILIDANSCEIGNGGAGGAGGNGGNGGTGGPGTAGTSALVLLYSGLPLALSEMQFDLQNQPLITVSDVNNQNVNVTFSANASQTWDLGTGANPMTPFGNVVTTLYNTTGRKDILYGNDSYLGFHRIYDPILINLVQSIDPSSPGNSDGSIEVSATGGTGNLTYAWDNGNNLPLNDNLPAGTYTLTVIDSEGCTAVVSYTLTAPFGSEISLCPTLFLEGAFNPATTSPADRMRTTLNDNSLIPLQQPYNTEPWEYFGPEAFDSPPNIPATMVDWVLIVIRDGNDPSIVLERHAGVLHADGSVTATSGNPITSGLSATDSYYLEINHRNHLPIISNFPIQADANDELCHDFTFGMEQAFRDVVLNDDPMAELNSASGIFFGMISGNALPLDDQVDINDITAIILGFDQSQIYLAEDVNLDGLVEINDIGVIFQTFDSNAHLPY